MHAGPAQWNRAGAPRIGGALSSFVVGQRRLTLTRTGFAGALLTSFGSAMPTRAMPGGAKPRNTVP